MKAFDGSLIWQKNLQNLTDLKPNLDLTHGVNWTVSRATPTIAGDDLLIVGIYGPAVVIAVKRSTGQLVWSTWLSTNIAGVITMSGTYYQGLVLNYSHHFFFFYFKLSFSSVVFSFSFLAQFFVTVFLPSIYELHRFSDVKI